ncbi:CD1871A family CXXC motif-containing protein [Agathobaculum massiliense]|nr:CD1871A family CXXC motif-containing protein [Agathobaculum massiliense]
MGCRKPWLAPCALLVLGAACTGYGILRGEPAIVLQKAVSICMECIGIG